MRALTLTQPWAALVVNSHKEHETRSWGTGYRGPLLIHAAKGWPRWAQLLVEQSPFNEALRLIFHGDIGTVYDHLDAQRGCIVGHVALTECRRITPELAAGQDEAERAFGDWTLGRFAWTFTDAAPFPQPVATRGALGLWNAEL